MTDKPYPFTPEQEAWLHDLETTREPQTMRYLHLFEPHQDNNDLLQPGYCCLGRACVVLGVPEKRNGNYGSFDNHIGHLPTDARLRLRLKVNAIETLIGMNDDGESFSQIAAYIRENAWTVFVLPGEEVE